MFCDGKAMLYLAKVEFSRAGRCAAMVRSGTVPQSEDWTCKGIAMAVVGKDLRGQCYAKYCRGIAKLGKGAAEWFKVVFSEGLA